MLLSVQRCPSGEKAWDTAPLACSPAPSCTRRTLQTRLSPAPSYPPYPGRAASPGPQLPQQKPQGKFPRNVKTWCGLGPWCPFPSRPTLTCPPPQVGRQAEGGWLHPAWQCQPLPPRSGGVCCSLAEGFIPQRPAEHPEVRVSVAARAHHRGDASAAPTHTPGGISPFLNLPKAKGPPAAVAKPSASRASARHGRPPILGPSVRWGGVRGMGGASRPRAVVPTDPHWI